MPNSDSPQACLLHPRSLPPCLRQRLRTHLSIYHRLHIRLCTRVSRCQVLSYLREPDATIRVHQEAGLVAPDGWRNVVLWVVGCVWSWSGNVCLVLEW